MRLTHALSFPLLAKELTELAARRRTYVVRAAYALLLSAAFLLFYRSVLRSASRSMGGVFNILGSGRDLLEIVAGLQFAGVFVFLPAMMSGALTHEKERGTLALLMVTDMRPREILLQKYLGRTVPMLTFLLLSLPLMAVAYSLGGVSAGFVASSAYFLLLSCLQVGALSLMCSSFAATTSQAFVASYVLGAAFYFSIALVAVVEIVLGLGRARWHDDTVFAFIPPYVWADTMRAGFGRAAWRSVPILFSTVFFLGVARAFVVRRAFATSKGALLAVFRRLDRFMAWANRLTGGVVIVRDGPALPGEAPVAWREVTKKALGRPAYLIRIFLALEIPTAAVAVLAASWSPSLGAEAMAVVNCGLWIVAALAVTAMSASAVSGERSRQTIDVLLTTPMTGARIMRQKTRAVARLMAVLALVFVTAFAAKAYCIGDSYYGSWYRGHLPGRTPLWQLYLAATAVALAVFLPAVAFLGLWIGARARSRAKAMVTALSILVGWCALPPLAMAILDEFLHLDHVAEGILLFASPASIVGLLEVGGLFREEHALWWFAESLAVGACVLAFFGWKCFARADRLLGRARGAAPDGST